MNTLKTKSEDTQLRDVELGDIIVDNDGNIDVQTKRKIKKILKQLDGGKTV